MRDDNCLENSLSNTIKHVMSLRDNKELHRIINVLIKGLSLSMRNILKFFVSERYDNKVCRGHIWHATHLQHTGKHVSNLFILNGCTLDYQRLYFLFQGCISHSVL